MVAAHDSQFELLRAEMGQMRRELHGEMVTMRTELRADMNEMRTELRADMKAMRTELRADVTEMHAMRRDMFHGAIALFGAQLATLAAILAVVLARVL